VHPDWGCDGFRRSGLFPAASAVAAEMTCSWAIRASTTFRRCKVAATSDLVPSGLYWLGFSTMPASMAACGSVSLAAGLLKYRCAATSTP